jgi:hypothetical protein
MPVRYLSFSITRPSDTTTYDINDAWAATTPAVGGSTLGGLGAANEQAGIITEAIVTLTANQSTALQGEIWLFDAAVTAIADNAAFTLTDAEINTCLGKIAFTMDSTGSVTSGANGNIMAHITGLNFALHAQWPSNIRALVKVKNAYVPVSGEVLFARFKVL